MVLNQGFANGIQDGCSGDEDGAGCSDVVDAWTQLNGIGFCRSLEYVDNVQSSSFVYSDGNGQLILKAADVSSDPVTTNPDGGAWDEDPCATDRPQYQNDANGWVGFRYKSAALSSECKFELPPTFRVQVRARVPQEVGMWAAPVWFKPAPISPLEKADDLDLDPEIDLIETLGEGIVQKYVFEDGVKIAQGSTTESPLLIHQNVHGRYAGDNDRNGSTSDPIDQAQNHPLPTAFNADGVNDGQGMAWHVYTIEKVPGSITMWVDNLKTAKWTNDSSPTGIADYVSWFDAAFNDPQRYWYMNINLQVGGWAFQPDSRTDWSQTQMKIDYVKAWTKGTPARWDRLHDEAYNPMPEDLNGDGIVSRDEEYQKVDGTLHCDNPKWSMSWGEESWWD